MLIIFNCAFKSLFCLHFERQKTWIPQIFIEKHYICSKPLFLTKHSSLIMEYCDLSQLFTPSTSCPGTPVGKGSLKLAELSL